MMESQAPSTSSRSARRDLLQDFSFPNRRVIPEPEHYGKATYALSRHRKNKVLVWQSKTLPGRVYEFVLATRFRIPGLYSWKCLHCSMIKQKNKKENGALRDCKIPLLLVDNDIIKENPDRPNNGPHFCQGRDVVDATVLRTKLVFYDAFAKGNLSQEEQHEAVELGVSTITPFQLTSNEEQTVRDKFNEKTVECINKVIKKRKTKQRNKIKAELEEIAQALLEKEEERTQEVQEAEPKPLVQTPSPIKKIVKLKPPENRTPSKTTNSSQTKRVILRTPTYGERFKIDTKIKLIQKRPTIRLPRNQEILLSQAVTPYSPLQLHSIDPEEVDDAPESDEIIDVES